MKVFYGVAVRKVLLLQCKEDTIGKGKSDNKGFHS